MTAIETELDRLIDLHDSRAKAAETRRRLSRGVYASHRRRALDDPSAHPLRRRRLTFRGEGLTLQELAERALVSERTLRELEGGSGGSDLTWARVARALDVNRGAVDRTWIVP